MAIQDLYTSWLTRDDSLAAHDLRSKLINKRKDNLNLPIEKQNTKYCFDKNLIPTLKQVNLYSNLFI